MTPTYTVRSDCWGTYTEGKKLYGGLIVTPDGDYECVNGRKAYRVISDGALNDCTIWFREDQLEPSEQTDWLEAQKETK